jgi:coproporphyrinogen III oxidase
MLGRASGAAPQRACIAGPGRRRLEWLAPFFNPHGARICRKREALTDAALRGRQLDMTDPATLDERKARARAWFEALQKRIWTALEALEQEADPALFPGEAGRFEAAPWRRGDGSQDQGGGTGGLLHGRLFEKAGVHLSTVYGPLDPAFAAQVKGADKDRPEFWASGLSLIVHPRSPRIPAVHMNTRMIATTESWFGGGMDLTPVLMAQRNSDHEDTRAFHAAAKRACDFHDPDYWPRFSKWCDEYFWLAHRNEPRGTGGIFFDHLQSDDWDADFGFAKDVGDAFLDVYPRIVRRRMAEAWTEEEREEQLVRRGRYVEFNLLYDRGTLFGLKTGGNVETILSSMPPVVKWP